MYYKVYKEYEMKTIVIAEHRHGEIRKITLENISLARSLGIPFEVVIASPGIETSTNLFGQYGAEKVFSYTHPELGIYSADVYAQIYSQIIQEHGAELVIMGATSTGKDLAPRIAAHLDAALATDCTKVSLEGGILELTRPMYAGKVLAKVQLKSQVKIVTVRPNVFTASEQPVTAALEEKSIEVPEPKTAVKELVSGETGKLDVTEADIIVSGGRGMKGPENWHLIEELASVLGAAQGASRAAVDAGWRPHDEQVGQTGKTVSPSLYVAVGISGAIQHLAGMSSSKYIVAINKDEDAPIFKIADYGIAGDAFEVVPKLIEELKARN
jgi:electron transfer flavoprotein alpha subunit